MTAYRLRHAVPVCPALPGVVLVILLAGCSALPHAQRGGGTTTTLGGTAAPTVVANSAPENPSTPSTTIVEKTTTREYIAPAPTVGAGLPRDVPPAESRREAAPTVNPFPVLREIVAEKATTTTGTAQKDTARDLGARLANLRGVLWVGTALLFGGPVIGWKLGWLTNGLIAGGVGLLLIILSTVIPGNEAWFGLGGLLVMPFIGFAYYKAHHDAALSAPSASKTSPPVA